MPRPKRIRRVTNPPHFKGFKPMGLSNLKAPIVVNFEEYEAIRLSDYDLHGQVEAAKIMGVSRPTFARIYESARRKIAQAFIDGKAIVFEGGKVYFDSDWYTCADCGCWFNHTEKGEKVSSCALCGSAAIKAYSDDEAEQLVEECQCPQCGREYPSIQHAERQDNICPECNCRMEHKRKPSHQRMKTQKCRL